MKPGKLKSSIYDINRILAMYDTDTASQDIAITTCPSDLPVIVLLLLLLP